MTSTERRLTTERDEALKKLKNAEREISLITKLMQNIVDKVNQTCGDESLTLDDFIFYWENAVNSDEDIFIDQFTTLITTSKLFFSEELYKIRVEETRKQEELAKTRQLRQQERLERRESYNELVTERKIELRECINRRTALLEKLLSKRYVIDELTKKEQSDAIAMLETRHIAKSLWFNKLIVIKWSELPLDHDNAYYKGADHPGCPYTGHHYGYPYG